MYNCPVRWYTVVDETSVDDMSVDEVYVDELSWNRILKVSWTQKKTNEWELEAAGMERGLLHIIKRRKLSYVGHARRKDGDCLEKEIMQSTIHRVQENKGNQGCDGWTTRKNGPECRLKTY